MSVTTTHDTRRTDLAAGVAALVAVALYLGATLVGALVVSGYSHLADSISELTSSTGAHRTAIAWGFAAYNVALAVFVFALWRSVLRTRASTIGAWLLGLVSIAGVGMVTVAPQDPLGEPLTGPGVAHLVLAGASAIGLIAAAFVWSRAFRSDARWAPLARPSFWFGLLILVLGGVGAVVGGAVPELFGAGERVTMVLYLTWFAWMGVHALRLASREA